MLTTSFSATWRIAAALSLSAIVTLAVAAEPQTQATQSPPAQTRTAATASAEQPSADEAAIRASADAYEKAFAAGDAKTLAATWTHDGELVDELGRTFKGREAIEREFAAIFADRPGATVDVEVSSVKFLNPDVAIETGTTRARAKDGSVGAPAQYTAVLVKEDGKWLLTNVNEARSPVQGSTAKLADLGWLIGEWRADLADGKSYQLRCEWMADKSFLRREFSVQQGDQKLSSGTQIIGFDPIVGQVVSWTFDSSGGFGHEIWEHDGTNWRVNASSVLPDGATSLSTNYLNKINDSTFTWQSVERSLNDQLLPNTAQVRVERVQ